jgi:hypothetical protein
MACAVPPAIDSGDAGSMGPKSQVFLPSHERYLEVKHFHFQGDGTLTFDDGGLPNGVEMTSAEVVRAVGRKAVSAKYADFAQGKASPSDAMFIALRVVDKYPRIAEAVASRFAEIVVDEIQDCSSVQLRILRTLHKTERLKSLVLIGDLDQSIYGWQGSEPAAVTDLARSLRLRELRLTTNFRSSQAICDVAWRFRPGGSPDRATGPGKDLGIPPEVFTYSASKPVEAVNIFTSRLAELGLPPMSYRVLGRKRGFVQKLNQQASGQLSPVVAVLGRCAYLYQTRGELDGPLLASAERMLGDLAWGPRNAAQKSPNDRARLRKLSAQMIAHLPKVAGTVGDWLPAARAVLEATVSELGGSPVKKLGNRIKVSSKGGLQKAERVFPWVTEAERVAATVHRVKGEAFGAVCLIAQKPHDWDNARDWVRHLEGGLHTEETRIAYVAITRAIAYMAVALPDSSDERLLELYTGAGFRRQTLTDSAVRQLLFEDQLGGTA